MNGEIQFRNLENSTCKFKVASSSDLHWFFIVRGLVLWPQELELWVYEIPGDYCSGRAIEPLQVVNVSSAKLILRSSSRVRIRFFVNSCWGDYWSSLRFRNSSSIRDHLLKVRSYLILCSPILKIEKKVQGSRPN